MSNAFNARFISNLSLDRLYRVYVERGEMFFIRIGGQSGVAVGVASQFGVVGALVLRSLKKRGDEKLAAKIADLDRQHPSSQLSAHKQNFHAASTAVEHSALEPAATIGAHGEHFGRWRLKIRDGKEMLLQFEALEDMKAAHGLLPALGSVHANNVVWDPAKNRFAKKVA